MLSSLYGPEALSDFQKKRIQDLPDDPFLLKERLLKELAMRDYALNQVDLLLTDISMRDRLLAACLKSMATFREACRVSSSFLQFVEELGMEKKDFAELEAALVFLQKASKTSTHREEKCQKE